MAHDRDSVSNRLSSSEAQASGKDMNAIPLPAARTLRAEQHFHPASRSGENRALIHVIRSGVDLGAYAFVSGTTTLGRDASCQLALHDFRASRRHAQIVMQADGQYLLTDLESTNGTYVNGELVTGARSLQNGDQILIGDTLLRFTLADDIESRFHAEVAQRANLDALTGLPTKERFDQALKFSLEYAQQTQQALALLMMDMDGVKQINDTHGHLFGAHVIGETGRLIAGWVGNRGQACRFGGDEFCAFITDCDQQAAQTLGETIRRGVESAGFTYEGIPLRPTISIGIAVYPQDGADPYSLTTYADAALYRAKAAGKNCVRW